MECPAPQSAIEAAARAAVNGLHGVDVNHRCDVASCTFVPVRQKLTRFGRPARVMVCKKSLHVHWCGPGVCQLANRKDTACDGAWTCPISQLEVTGQAEVYVPQRNRARSNSTGTAHFTDTMTMKKRTGPSTVGGAPEKPGFGGTRCRRPFSTATATTTALAFRGRALPPSF